MDIIFAASSPDSGNTIGIIQILVPIVLSLITGFGVVALYKGKVDRLEKDVEKLEKKVDATRTDCEAKIAMLRTDSDQLLEFKTQAQKFIDKNIYKDQSPLSLTEFGQQMVDDSGFKEIFEQVKDNLVEMLEEQKPDTQYDAQEKARSLMDSLASYQPFKPIEKYAFEHGKDLNQILRAGAILLRDYYITKHPEIVNPKEQW
jgi:hypothetical protein